MGGFTDGLNNHDFCEGLLALVISHVRFCCDEMKNDCINKNEKLHNDEPRITCRLVENHLNYNQLELMFIPESLESYDHGEDHYAGRADIKVITRDNLGNRNKGYFLIECKRIDGYSDLNTKYVKEGVARFVVNPAKYPSHFNRNIMCGYVVQAINITRNASIIERIQHKLLDDVVSGVFDLMEHYDSEYYLYSCKYKSEVGNIELRHIFYDFSSVVY